MSSPKQITLDCFFCADLNFTSEAGEKKSTFNHFKSAVDVEPSLSWADTGGIKHRVVTSRLDNGKAPFVQV